LTAISGSAAALTTTTTATTPKPKCSTLLICDRTFCNLEAVAQRLVGQWTGTAIRLLTPSWSTDIARDYLAATCPKICANDCADEIIHDYSSLKAGLSFAGELTKGQTRNVGWMMSVPLEYRLADLDNVGVANGRMETRCCGGGAAYPMMFKNPPTWPADKRVSWSEAYHFAACLKRIGKLATVAKKQMQQRASDGGLSNMEGVQDEEEAEGVEVSYLSENESSGMQMSPFSNTDSGSKMPKKKSETEVLLIKIWSSLACCDGLCGHPLGHAVKEGFDCTISWLCCAVVFGSQVLAEKAEQRWNEERRQQQQQGSSSREGSMSPGLDDDSSLKLILPDDFDLRPNDGYQWDENDLARHPLPIPVVLSSLKDLYAQNKNALEKVEAELNYVMGMLGYIISRLTCKENNNALSPLIRRQKQDDGAISTGFFINLHCGHNNQYSLEERQKLMNLIHKMSDDVV